MKAHVITQYGGPEVLQIRDLPDPAPDDGEVLIRVRAFGVNHAEAYMRSGAWGPVAAVTGIECAGIVVADRSGRFTAGETVVALLGGMGRTRDGSYAELVTVPADNVVAVHTALDWADLAAIPEVYATAWSILHGDLALRPGEMLLVRGGTSALGQALINIAAEHGATVVATTRDGRRTELLTRIGADSALVDDGRLAEQVRARGWTIDAVADLVGNRVLRDSLALAGPRGRVCQAGFLGGFDPVDNFDPLADLPTGVRLSFFGSAFVLGTPGWPLSSIPFDAILAKAAAGVYQTKPVRTFTFDEVAAAHTAMEAGTAGGKLTVVLE